MQPGEQREAAAERVVPEEELEGGGLLVPPGPPVRVGHGELVHVGEQRRDPLPERPLHEPACAAGRSCHVLRSPAPGSLRSLGLEVQEKSVIESLGPNRVGTSPTAAQPVQHDFYLNPIV